MQISSKLREIRRETGWSQEELALKLGSSQASINRWLSGKADPRGSMRDEIDALYNDVFKEQVIFKVPLIGIVGAGQAVYPINDGANDMVEAPENALDSTVAVEVRGESMLPWLEDGWLIYYSRHLPPEELVNRRAVVQLEDGRLLVKTIQHGSQSGLWSLSSTNAAPITDVAVRWAAPIDWIKPRY